LKIEIQDEFLISSPRKRCGSARGKFPARRCHFMFFQALPWQSRRSALR